jgi:hypothetical protein
MGSSLAGWVEWKRHVIDPTHSLWRPLMDAEFLLNTSDMYQLKALLGDEDYADLWERDLPEDVSPFVREQNGDTSWHGGFRTLWLTLPEVRSFADSLEHSWRRVCDVMVQAAAETRGFRPEEHDTDAYVRVVLWWYW